MIEETAAARSLCQLWNVMNPVDRADRLEIRPLDSPASATIEVPGSKSITNRALVLGALASFQADCILKGALRSEDTEVMASALAALGQRGEAKAQFERAETEYLTASFPDAEGLSTLRKEAFTLR